MDNGNERSYANIRSMKTISRTAFFTAVGLLVPISCGAAYAELPPGAYKKLKKETEWYGGSSGRNLIDKFTEI